MSQKSRTDVYDPHATQMNAGQMERAARRKLEVFEATGVMPGNPYAVNAQGQVTRANSTDESYVKRQNCSTHPVSLGKRGKDSEK